MFNWINRWLKKLELKEELERDMKHLFVQSVWGKLNGDYIEKLNELKERYVARGLTRKEVDKVHKKIKPIKLG